MLLLLLFVCLFVVIVSQRDPSPRLRRRFLPASEFSNSNSTCLLSTFRKAILLSNEWSVPAWNIFFHSLTNTAIIITHNESWRHEKRWGKRHTNEHHICVGEVEPARVCRGTFFHDLTVRGLWWRFITAHVQLIWCQGSLNCCLSKTGTDETKQNKTENQSLSLRGRAFLWPAVENKDKYMR